MPATYTPLRYPGGKTKLYNVIRPLLEDGGKLTYVEPFAGGAGLALKLLFCDDVKSIMLNDIDSNIYMFWKACLNQTDEMCKLVSSAELTIEEWEKQRGVLMDSDCHTEIERAFALFYLNRCNRSGIIKGGPIGGKKQTGKYKIDARFNKDSLIRKIESIGKKRENISVFNMDAKEFLTSICNDLNPDNCLINIDPPYVNKGPILYQNSFSKEDHVELSKVIKNLKQPWIVTYDADKLVKELYGSYQIKEIELGYSAGKDRKKGHEYLITNMGGWT